MLSRFLGNIQHLNQIIKNKKGDPESPEFSGQGDEKCSI